MILTPTPRDDNGHPLVGAGTVTGTKVFEDIDTDGTDIILGADCKSALITCVEGPNAWIWIGTDTVDNDEITEPLLGVEIDIAVPAGTPLGTVKAVTGTVNVSVRYVR
jgi:2-keto-3-deoxy-6-phosphogluconate aldolase